MTRPNAATNPHFGPSGARPYTRLRMQVYWRMRDVGWRITDIGNEMRYHTAWVGQVMVMVLCAAALAAAGGVALALAVVLWAFR